MKPGKALIVDQQVARDYATPFHGGERVDVLMVSKATGICVVSQEGEAKTYKLPAHALGPVEAAEQVDKPRELVEPPHLGSPRTVAAIEAMAGLLSNETLMAPLQKEFGVSGLCQAVARTSLQYADALLLALSMPIKGDES